MGKMSEGVPVEFEEQPEEEKPKKPVKEPSKQAVEEKPEKPKKEGKTPKKSMTPVYVAAAIILIAAILFLASQSFMVQQPETTTSTITTSTTTSTSTTSTTTTTTTSTSTTLLVVSSSAAVKISAYEFASPYKPDKRFLHEEWVELTNTGDVAVNLEGWRIRNWNYKQTMTLPEFYLAPGKSVKIRTGSGWDTESDIYMGLTREFWDNEVDAISVFDPDGNLVDYWKGLARAEHPGV